MGKTVKQRLQKIRDFGLKVLFLEEKNKKVLILVFVLVFIFINSFSFAKTFSGEVKTQTTYYDVGGNTKNSFYEPENLEYLTELFLNMDKSIFKDWSLKGNLNLRATDDRMIDQKDFSLERFFSGGIR